MRSGSKPKYDTANQKMIFLSPATEMHLVQHFSKARISIVSFRLTCPGYKVFVECHI